MLVECVRDFRDLDCGVMRMAGDRFEVSPERLGRLNATKYGQLVSEVSEIPPEASETPSEAPQRARAKRRGRTAGKS